MTNSILILHDIVIVVLLLFAQWIVAYFKQSGKNTAIKNDNRDISYEGKKGENVAIEEDQIQLSHKERLIRILYLAEKINQSQNKYLLYFYDVASRTRFDNIVEDLNDMLTDLYHEQRLINLFLPQNQQKILEELLTYASGMVAEMSTNSTNAAHCISAFNHFMDYANIHKDEQKRYWDYAKTSQAKLEDIKNTKLTFKEDYQKAIQNYANWLGEYIKQDIRVIGE